MPVPYFERYSQVVTIHFTDDASATQADVRMLPLYDGREWAISSRWDDTDPRHRKMRDVLLKHGYKGTFYLNGLDNVEPDTEGLDRELLEGGCTIGGHSWSHPHLTYCSRNRVFDEIARVRVGREASADTGICSFTFPFIVFQNEIEGPRVTEDLIEALFRAGYYHAADNAIQFKVDERQPALTDHTDVEMPLSYLLPMDDLAPIDGPFAVLLADEHVRRTNPCISFDMHTWYETDEQWAKFESQLEQYGRRPEWWYCNQNQYGAYRLQYLKTQVKTERRGNTLVLTLDRPRLCDLNDPVPLTFEVAGVSRTAITAIESDGARIEQADGETAARFHLYHAESQRLPVHIAWASNDKNGDTVSPGELEALLTWRKNKLQLYLVNNGETPLRDVRVTYRMPLAFEPGVEFRHALQIAPQQVYEDTLRPASKRDDAKYTYGSYFFVAQVDFVRDGEAARLYATCTTMPNPESGPAYPNQSFVRMGPIPETEFSMAIAEELAKGVVESLTLNDDVPMHWEKINNAEVALSDVELACITGRGYWFDGDKALGYYLLRTRVFSETLQPVVLKYPASVVKAVFLNGGQLESVTTTLEPGANDLMFVYKTLDIVKITDKIIISLGQENEGLFMRIAVPGSAEPAPGIRYALPRGGYGNVGCGTRS